LHYFWPGAPNPSDKLAGGGGGTSPQPSAYNRKNILYYSREGERKQYIEELLERNAEGYWKPKKARRNRYNKSIN